MEEEYDVEINDKYFFEMDQLTDDLICMMLIIAYLIYTYMGGTPLIATFIFTMGYHFLGSSPFTVINGVLATASRSMYVVLAIALIFVLKLIFR